MIFFTMIHAYGILSRIFYISENFSIFQKISLFWKNGKKLETLENKNKNSQFLLLKMTFLQISTQNLNNF